VGCAGRRRAWTVLGLTRGQRGAHGGGGAGVRVPRGLGDTEHVEEPMDLTGVVVQLGGHALGAQPARVLGALGAQDVVLGGGDEAGRPRKAGPG
jgi:hypothetical protein